MTAKRGARDPRLLMLLLCLLSTFYSIYTTLSLTTTTNCSTDDAPTQLTRSNSRNNNNKSIKGVFILKVERAEQAVKALCTLTHFFKHHIDPYDVRIFVDYPDTMNVTGLILDDYGRDIQVIHDDRWMKLPDELLSPSDLQDISQNHCKNLTTPSSATCSSLNVKLNILYSYLWSYYYMGEEPSLQSYEYFVMMDAEAYLTQPIPDPFQLLRDNDLVGFFDIEAYQQGEIAKGVQETANSMFTLQERKNRYLNSPDTQFFDNNGVWNSQNGSAKKPSIWTHFYGGRLDFFRTSRYKEFARCMIPHLYKSRVDDQAVIGAAWALLSDNDRVWYLPKRGIHLGIYHQGWVDNREAVRKVASRSEFEFHTLDRWDTYTEHYGMLLSWEEYVDQIGYGGGDWHMCRAAPDKGAKFTTPYKREVRPGIGEEMLSKASNQIKRLLSRNVTSFVISLDQADKFRQQNRHSINSTTVIPAVQGWTQESMDAWADLRGEAPKKISDYDRTKHKSQYDSPHAVGCYLSHWNLWRTLHLWQQEPLPEFYFIFEDDTVCGEDMYRIVSETVRQLPSGWDMLYIGGKPFTYFRKGPLRKFNDSTALTLARDICQGAFGRGEGPLAPDGSRNVSESQPFWKAHYITNTDAYVINPRRLKHLLYLMKPEVDTPIDIRLADKMQAGQISAYMTTRKCCEQGVGQMNVSIAWQNMYSVFLNDIKDFDTNAHPALGQAINGRYLYGLPIVLGNNCSY